VTDTPITEIKNLGAFWLRKPMLLSQIEQTSIGQWRTIPPLIVKHFIKTDFYFFNGHGFRFDRRKLSYLGNPTFHPFSLDQRIDPILISLHDGDR
jgi:hypothetical protein